MARIPAFQAGGPGSIPGGRIFRLVHWYVAFVAQMVERKTLNLVVVGSSPTEGAVFTLLAALAQLGERQTEDLKVPGSIPGGGIFQPWY